jgi:hypothetical protein
LNGHYFFPFGGKFGRRGSNADFTEPLVTTGKDVENVTVVGG